MQTAVTASIPIWLALTAGPKTALAQGPASQARPRDYFQEAFGISGADMDRIMREALKNGGDFCDLYFQHSAGNWVVMEDGKINRAYTAVKLGMGVRVLKGEQTGYAFSQVLEMPAMLEAARTAASLAQAGGTAPGGRGVEVRPLKPKPGLNLYPCVKPWAEATIQDRLDLLKRVNQRLGRAESRIIKTVAQFNDSTSRVLLATSEGVLRADIRPRTGLLARCVAEQKGRRESNYQDITTRSGLEFYTQDVLEQVADQAVARTLRLFEARPLDAGMMPCVLAPGSSGILLHEAVGHGLEADFNRRRMSTYADRLGQKVAGGQVTIIDDGTLAHAHGAINFDDEGADSQRTVLVEKGVLRSYLQDRLSAGWYKTGSTGSGRRQSFEHAPMPRMRATFMQPGPYKPAEIIASVKKGLYAEQFTNGQVNIGAGDFSFYVKSGFAIEDGKLTHPVKDVNVTGNGPETLANVTMVGDDLAMSQGGYMCGKRGQSVPVSMGLPTTLVSTINVGGAATA